MKRSIVRANAHLVAALLAAISFSVCATSRPYTLDLFTPDQHIVYHAEHMTVDAEDLIKSVEINDAQVLPQLLYPDLVFSNGFEDIFVNWIWVGDDTINTEIGGYGHCIGTMSNNGKTLVLICNPGVIEFQGNS